MTLSSFVFGESDFCRNFSFDEIRKIDDLHNRVPSMGTIELSRVILLLLFVTVIKGNNLHIIL